MNLRTNVSWNVSVVSEECEIFTFVSIRINCVWFLFQFSERFLVGHLCSISSPRSIVHKVDGKIKGVGGFKFKNKKLIPTVVSTLVLVE